jgi:hypothetical protein
MIRPAEQAGSENDACIVAHSVRMLIGPKNQRVSRVSTVVSFGRVFSLRDGKGGRGECARERMVDRRCYRGHAAFYRSFLVQVGHARTGERIDSRFVGVPGGVVARQFFIRRRVDDYIFLAVRDVFRRT